jgi:hypothetical protein
MERAHSAKGDGLRCAQPILRAVLGRAYGPTRGPTKATSVADLLGRDVELDHLHILGIARRLAGACLGEKPGWKIQLNRAPIRKTTTAFCNAKVRAAATNSGWSSGITPLPIGEARNDNWAFSVSGGKFRLTLASGVETQKWPSPVT